MTDYTAPLGTQYTLRLSVTLVSQNVAANTSTVGWTLTAIKNTGSGYWDYSAPTNWATNIGGTAYSGSIASYDFRDYRELVLASGTTVVTHAANGSKSIAVSGSWDADNSSALQPGTVSSGGSPLVLTSIPRATQAKVSPSPATQGSQVIIDVTPAVSGWTHTLTWASGSLSGTIATNAFPTSMIWTVPTVMGEFPGKKQGPITITTVTKNGGATVGTTTTTLMARLAPTYTDPSGLTFPYDLRARLVTYEGGTWAARRTIPTSTISLVDPHSATATCAIQVSRLVMPDIEDYGIVDIEAQDGNQWLSTGLRFVLTRVEDDDTDLSETVKYSGTNFIDYELAHAYTRTELKWESTNPGGIFQTLFTQAKGRGWGPLVLADGFTNVVTSLGTPWPELVARTIPKGTPYSQVLEGLVSDGLVEYRTDYRDNKAYLSLFAPGTGSDWAVAGADPIVDLSTAPLNSAPRRGSIEDRITRVTVAGDGDLLRTRERTPDDSAVFGALEGWVAASGIKDATEADRIGDATLADNNSANNERTFVFSANAADRHLWPYYSVRPGDWVRIPGIADDAPERARVGQITLSRDNDGDVTATILTGERILSGTGALAKRQQAQTGNAIPGGSLSSPATLDSSIPAAPIVISATSVGYWNSDGAAKSTITLVWSEVTTSVSGSALPVDYYEIWWRPDVTVPWALQTVSGDLTVDMIGWDVNKPVDLRVRARSAYGIFGQWSLYDSIVTNEPNTPLASPGTPIVTANALGTIFIEWAGLIGGAPAPAQLAYTRAEIALSSGGPFTPAGVPMASAGSTSVDPGAYGTYFIRLRAVDRLGLDGTPSSVVSITTVDPGLVLRTPAAPTGLTYTTGTAFSEDGSTLQAWFDLEWDAVTLDTDGNAITISGYEVWGHPDTETDMRLLASVEGTETRAFVAPGSSWTLAVRAISDVGARGEFSSDITADADGTVAALATPSTPTVTSEKSNLIIAWDGLLGGVTPPNQFRFVYAEYAPSDTMVYVRVGATFQRGGGAVFVPLDVGQEYVVRLTAVDSDGVASAHSSTATETVEGIAPADMTALIENMLTEPRIETDSAPDTGVKLFSGGIVAYDTSGNPTVFISAEDGTIYFSTGVISGDAIVAGTITGNKLDVGSIVTTLVSSDLANSLNLASNNSVNILVGNAVAPVQAGVDSVTSNLGTMQTYYQFGPLGARITSPGSPFEVQISNSQISMVANGNIVSFWNAAGLTAPSLIANQTATIGAHQFRKEGTRTTVRAL